MSLKYKTEIVDESIFIECFNNNKKIANIFLTKENNKYYIEDIYVKTKYRRQGIATKLYSIANKLAKKDNCILISSFRIGENSRKFWEKQIKNNKAKVLNNNGTEKLKPSETFVMI